MSETNQLLGIKELRIIEANKIESHNTQLEFENNCDLKIEEMRKQIMEQSAQLSLVLHRFNWTGKKSFHYVSFFRFIFVKFFFFSNFLGIVHRSFREILQFSVSLLLYKRSLNQLTDRKLLYKT